MGTRGRKSAASLAVLSGPSKLEIVDRLKPPHDLTDEEVEVWVGVTSAEAADWFTAATAPLLSQYCRHVVRARHVAEWIEAATGSKELSIEDYDRLLKMQARESGVLATLATKMRISQQSTTNHRGNKKPSAVRRPWEG